MLNINMDMLKCENDNASAVFFQKHRKTCFFRKFNIFFGQFLVREEFVRGWGGVREEEVKRHSTSPPCGNLVDGSPYDCHTETVGYENKKEPTMNGTTTPQIRRVSNVLLDELKKSAQKTL